MDTILPIFIALVFVVILWNTALLWFFYRDMKRSADQIGRCQRHCSRLIVGLRPALERAEDASSKAADWSGQLRERMVEASQNVDRVENWLGYGLAKIDFNVDRVSNEVNESAKRMKAAVSEPLFRTERLIGGVGALLELLAPAGWIMRLVLRLRSARP